MYGDVLSYPVDDTEVARAAHFARGGARSASRAPLRPVGLIDLAEVALFVEIRSEAGRAYRAAGI